MNIPRVLFFVWTFPQTPPHMVHATEIEICFGVPPQELKPDLTNFADRYHGCPTFGYLRKSLNLPLSCQLINGEFSCPTFDTWAGLEKEQRSLLGDKYISHKQSKQLLEKQVLNQYQVSRNFLL